MSVATTSSELKAIGPPKSFDVLRYTRIAQLILSIIFLALAIALMVILPPLTLNNDTPHTNAHFLLFVPSYSIVATLYLLYLSLHPSLSPITFTHRPFGAYSRHIMPLFLEFTIWVLWLAAWAVAASSLVAAEKDKKVREEALCGALVGVGVLVWVGFCYSGLGCMLRMSEEVREEESDLSARMPRKVEDGGRGLRRG